MLRAATTGDYFITAVPVGEDLERVRGFQEEIASTLGGEVEPYVHLTLQRFEIEDPATETSMLDAVQEAVSSFIQPEVVAEGLFSTYHRYFERHSVRWQIDPTQNLGRLTLLSAQSILHQGGRSHWPNAEAPIAQFMTAVWIPEDLSIPDSLTQDYPRTLMTVTHLEVTRILENGEFATLRTFDI